MEINPNKTFSERRGFCTACNRPDRRMLTAVSIFPARNQPIGICHECLEKQIEERKICEKYVSKN